MRFLGKVKGGSGCPAAGNQGRPGVPLKEEQVGRRPPKGSQEGTGSQSQKQKNERVVGVGKRIRIRCEKGSAVSLVTYIFAWLVFQCIGWQHGFLDGAARTRGLHLSCPLVSFTFSETKMVMLGERSGQ